MFLTTYWPFKKIKKFFHGCKETSDSLTSHAGNSAFTHQVRPVIKAEIHSGWSWDCFFFRSQRSNTSKGRPNDTLPCQATTFLPQGQTLGGEESRDYSPAVITGEIENSFSWSLHNRAFFWQFEKNQGQKSSSLKKLKQIIQKLDNSPTKTNFFSWVLNLVASLGEKNCPEGILEKIFHSFE